MRKATHSEATESGSFGCPEFVERINMQICIYCKRPWVGGLESITFRIYVSPFFSTGFRTTRFSRQAVITQTTFNVVITLCFIT